MAALSVVAHFRTTNCVLTANPLVLLPTASADSDRSSAPAPPGTGTAGSSDQRRSNVGDATVDMTAIQTAAIPAQVAWVHGIARRRKPDAKPDRRLCQTSLSTSPAQRTTHDATPTIRLPRMVHRAWPVLRREPEVECTS